MTAVEWLQNKLPPLFEHDNNDFYKKLFEQAKAMEKEQIIKAYDSGGDHYTDFGNPIWGIDYYNETYNKSKTPPGAHCKEA